jgi:transketolase
VPTLSLSDGRFAPAEGLRRGGYILIEAEGGEPQVILLASGSEVGIALEARGILQGRQIPTRVVSLPSWFLFQQQDRSYRESVLPGSVAARVSVEAGTTLGWERWTGPCGASVGIDRFGASAPWKRIYQELGITPEAVVEAALESLDAEARVGAPA